MTLEQWLKLELADSVERAEDSDQPEFEAGFIAALEYVLNRIEGE